ncbi:hypothetical protein B0H14DRAFT_2642582, partial [Mycena olivaceomarginata]
IQEGGGCLLCVKDKGVSLDLKKMVVGWTHIPLTSVVMTRPDSPFSTSISSSSTSSHTPPSSPSSPSSTSDGTPAGGNLNANWGDRESRVARLVLELEVEAVNTSQHEDEGKRREELGMGVRSGGRGTPLGRLFGACCRARRRGGTGDDRWWRWRRARGDGERAAEAHRGAVGFGASSCLQAGAGTGSHQVADVDVDAAEVEDRMCRAGTEGEGKEAGARVMKPLACEA